MSDERERLERELQEVRTAFDDAKNRWEYLDRSATAARSDMDVVRTLGIIREEALRRFREGR